METIPTTTKVHRYTQAADEQELINYFPEIESTAFGGHSLDARARIFFPIRTTKLNPTARCFVPRSSVL